MNSAMLDDFCHGLTGGWTPQDRLQPPEVARRFVGFFGFSPFPRMGEMVRVLETAGIETVADPNLEKGLRGMHLGTSHGTYIIRYDPSEPEGTREHTVFHETYEIIRERLADLHPRLERPWGKAMCRLADRFAAAALIQPRFFALFAETTGLDVMELQRTYGRAYSSLTIRLAEVMRHQPLLAVLYERSGARDPQRWAERPSPEEFTATVVARTPGFRLRTVKRPLSALRGLLPRRGYPPAQYSVAERVILTGRPVYVERVTGYDLWKTDDITVAARLVHWHGRLAKIAVVAVPFRDRKVLAPQFTRVSFEHISNAHQVM